MRLVSTYSHLNGKEYLMAHHPDLLDEVRDVIGSVDAESHRTKESKEKRRLGAMLLDPAAMNATFKERFFARGWTRERNPFWVTRDEAVLRDVIRLAPAEQKQRIADAGYDPIHSYNETDFMKDRVAVEVQFGKYSFVAHDLFVKHLAFYFSGVIDVGIEILPMKEMSREMSSGVAYYERDLLNVLRQGRGVPAVPLWMIGVAP